MLLQMQQEGSGLRSRAIAAGTAFALTAAIVLLHANSSLAQSTAGAAQRIAYVASVKPNNDMDTRTISEYSPGGRFSATAVTVSALLRMAYRIQPYQLLGAPGWISTRRYDIAAKAEEPAPSQQAFLRALLEDRFKLSVHAETREQPIFALVVARSDGRLGPQLRTSAFNCEAYFAGPHAPPEPGRTPDCATRIGPAALYGKAIDMSRLATSLAPFAGRFTVDQTGLSGVFDVELTWTPEQPPGNLAGAAPEIPADSPGPSIFTALQEQLGLKLVSQRGPVAVLVVEHIEEPSGN